LTRRHAKLAADLLDRLAAFSGTRQADGYKKYAKLTALTDGGIGELAEIHLPHAMLRRGPPCRHSCKAQHSR
jgi:hypothetical protein